MQYVIHFEISAAIILLVILGDYFRHKKIPTIQNKTYGWLLIFSFSGTVLNILTVLVADIAIRIPIPVLFLLNVAFLLATGISTVLFFIYTVALAGKLRKLHTAAVFFLLLPYIIEAVFMLATFFTDQVFYFDQMHQYRQGPMHWTLYLVYYLYGGGGFLWIMLQRKKIGIRRTILIAGTFLIISFFVVIQYLYPRYMLIGLSAAIPLMVYYHSIQNPYNQVDTLTGVYNRAVLVPYLKEFFESRIPFSVYVFALDDFKQINSIIGIKNGDILLKKVAQYFDQTMPDGNVFRLSGDQFAVIASGVIEDIENVEYYVNHFPKIWMIEETAIQLSSCVLGFNGLEYQTVGELLTTVDYAIVSAKKEGKSSYHLVDKSYKDSSLLNKKVNEALIRGIEQDRIKVFYQPIVSRKENRVVAAEALVRLDDEILGPIAPDIFIRIAEQNGLITKVGDIVLEKVCMFLNKNDIIKWNMDHIDVNLSVIQCMQENLEERIFSILEKYEVDPSMIDFEITESAAASFATLEKNLQKIYQRGISFSLDDFGTGFANMEYIVRLPFDTIKLDKNLLWTSIESNSKTEFFKNITHFINEMGLSVICEGAETQEHIEYLEEAEIDCIQGYFYSPPLCEADFIRFMNYFCEKNHTLS